MSVNTPWTKTAGDQRTHLWRRATRLNERYYVYTRVMVSNQTKRVWLSVFDAVTMMLTSTTTVVNIKERIKHVVTSILRSWRLIDICISIDSGWYEYAVVADINLIKALNVIGRNSLERYRCHDFFKIFDMTIILIKSYAKFALI